MTWTERCLDPRPWAFLVVLSACEPSAPEVLPHPCDDPPELSIAVGTGEETFETLEPGTVLEFVPGPQGCCHVWGGLKADGVVPGAEAREIYFETRFNFVLTDAEDGTVLGGILGISPTVYALDGGAWDVAGVTVFVDDVDVATGRPFDLTVDVEDACGRTASHTASGMLGAIE